MARPRSIQNADWEANLASMSLAGIRPIVHATQSVPGTSEATYTVTDPTTKRVVLLHDAGTNLALTVALNSTASVTTLPVLPGVYFVLEVDPGDVVHLYNTTGAPVVVYVTEIR